MDGGMPGHADDKLLKFNAYCRAKEIVITCILFRDYDWQQPAPLGGRMEAITKLIHDLLLFLFPGDCFEELVLKFHIFNRECVRMVASRFLGCAIIVGSSLVKVPQIMKMYEQRSGAGLSFASQLFELVAYSSTVMYSHTKQFHFSAWGEAFFLAAQSVIIIALLLWFGGRGALLLLTLAAYAILCALYVQDFFSEETLTVLQGSATLLLLLGRVLQVLENYRNQSTGQLSAVTFSLLTLGGIARVFTSVQETGDSMIILQYILSTTLNVIICWQIYAYWDRKIPLKKVQ